MKPNFNKLLLSAFTLMMAVSTHVQAQTITTIAGGNAAGYGPDNVQATASKLNTPTAVATDDSGNVFIADKTNNRIRKVSKTGMITTVAGTGTAGYTGDGAAATLATLSAPSGVARDNNTGNLYIADFGNNVVRQVTPTGVITTIAGQGPTGVGYTGDNGPATASKLDAPVDVAVNPNSDIFIVDQSNFCIRKIDGVSGVITTYAGTGSGGFNFDNVIATTAQLNIPTNVCSDKFGNIYIVDQNNYRVRKVDATTKMISTVAGTGVGGYNNNGELAVDAKLQYPSGVAVDGSGNIFISDNDEVRLISALTGDISIYAGEYDSVSFAGDGGPATVSKLNTPKGLAVDTSGNVYLADEGNNRIRKITKRNTTGIQQVAMQNGNIQLLPNPNNGAFIIKGSLNLATDEAVSFLVTDMLGQAVYENSIMAHKGMVNTPITLGSSLPDGCYLLHIRSGTQNEITRFVIQK